MCQAALPAEIGGICIIAHEMTAKKALHPEALQDRPHPSQTIVAGIDN